MLHFWKILIVAVCLAFFFGLLILLYKTSKVDKDETKVTGHKWDDDLEELNMPLPKWWLYTFIATMVFALGYSLYYPTFGQTHKGSDKWSSVGELEKEVAESNAKYKDYYTSITSGSIEEISKNPKALVTGGRVFKQFCAACHASDASGGFGYPNLADSDWLYGGKADNILASITNGRNGMMPSQKAILESMAKSKGLAKDKAIEAVADYVLTLYKPASGKKSLFEVKETEFSKKGGELFAGVCAACHTPAGTGMAALGAPNLTDGTWLYYKGKLNDKAAIKASIVETITKGRYGVMPSHKDKISKEKLKLVTAFIYNESHTKDSK